jgi:hypothetical protein
MKTDLSDFVRILKPDEMKALDRLSSAMTLTVIELQMYPELVQAQLLANLMSPSLWEWI